MDNSTKKLLEECSVGCKMGIESMEQVQHHVTDAGIAGVIEKYCSRHKELRQKSPKCSCVPVSRRKNRESWSPHSPG